ncbi:transmembrane amino acid transporter protein-domain-containing protein [Aspergillus tetrazonus]
MSFSVQGKTAIVTGAGSGINLSFAKQLLENGCNVLIADLALRPEAQTLVDQYAGKTPRAVFERTDVREWKQLEQMFEVAEKEFGDVDIVCPGAGIYEPHWSNFWRPPGTAVSRDPPDGDRYALIDINLTHPIRTSQLAISHFLKSGTDSTRRKAIVHISSIAGQNPFLAAPIYVATKHAINGFVRSLAKLDERCGIRVTAVAPGIIKTPLWTDHPEKLKIVDDKKDAWVTPDEVATVMLALVQQDQASEVIGDFENKEGKEVYPIRGGTILEVSKTVRSVSPYNDPGPGTRPGNTVSTAAALEDEVWELLGERGARRGVRGKQNPGSHGQASWISCVINLVNTIVGAGVLAMPLAISHMGIVLGISVILWSGVTAGFGLYLQSRCAQYLDKGSASFFALSQITYPNAAVIFDAAIAIKCFGVGVSYLIIIGDLMPGVVQGFVGEAAYDFLVDRHFWVTAFMLIIIPLSYLRRLDSLKYTSIAALVSMAYLVILVVYHFIIGDTKEGRGPIRVIRWAGAVPTLSSFPVIVFAFTCHQNMFSILNEISNNSHFRTTAVVLASIGSSATTYILVAITGYLSFGNSVGGNIVGMYPPGVWATIGRAAIVILVMFSYPLQCHPCRASVDAVLHWRPKRFTRSRSEGSPHRHPLLPAGPRGSRTPEPMSDLRFSVITTSILILSYIVAMSVSSLEAVLAYVGSTGSTSISFILPGMFYYKISAPDSAAHQRLMKEDDEAEDGYISGASEDDGIQSRSLTESGILRRHTRNWRRALLRKLSLGLAIYGVIVMITCLVTNSVFLASH